MEQTCYIYSTWRMQVSILEDSPTREMLRTTITNYLAENTGTATSPMIEWGALKVMIRGACIHNSIGAKCALQAEFN